MTLTTINHDALVKSPARPYTHTGQISELYAYSLAYCVFPSVTYGATHVDLLAASMANGSLVPIFLGSCKIVNFLIKIHYW